MTLAVVSNELLAHRVAEKAELPAGGEIIPVAEFATAPLSPCDATELLSWMGSMTAGPPTLAAEVLRSAGSWAWIRYRWALEDMAGIIRPTPDARAIRGHTRSMFSETVGVGAAGYLGCLRLVPAGFLAIANLDDVMEPLERDGLIRRRHNWGKKQPDYLLASGEGGLPAFGSGSMHLTAIECKGTIKSENAAIGQLSAGVRQVVGIESDLPLRRFVFATTLELDENEPIVNTYAIEVKTTDRPHAPLDLAAAWDSILDAALIRGLRIVGRHQEAERLRHGYSPDAIGQDAEFQIEENWMAGESVELLAGATRLRAEVGIDVELLRTLELRGSERRQAIIPVLNRLSVRDQARRRPVDNPEELRQEVLLRDGTGVRLERNGPPARSDIPPFDN